jgi:hypothetical protein
MTRRQPPITALLCMLLTGAHAFVPANYRNPALVGPKKTPLAGSGLAFPQSQAFAKSQTPSASSTILHAVPTGAALAAITGAITGGLFAGGLHAIAGKSITFGRTDA